MSEPPRQPDETSIPPSAGRWLVFLGGLVAFVVLAILGSALAVT